MRRERVQRALRPLTAPVPHMRRIQSLASQQGAELTRLMTRIGFIEDLELVGSGELTTVRTFNDFGVRWRGKSAVADRSGRDYPIHSGHSADSFPALCTNFRYPFRGVEQTVRGC